MYRKQPESGEGRAEGLTLFPGGPDGPGSPVGPGDPWLGERTQNIRNLSHQDTGMCGPQPRKHMEIQFFLWLGLHGLLSGVSIASPGPCWWHSENPTHIPHLLHLEHRYPPWDVLESNAWTVWSPPSPTSHFQKNEDGSPRQGVGSQGHARDTSGSQPVSPALHFHCCLSQISDTSLCPWLSDKV